MHNLQQRVQTSKPASPKGGATTTPNKIKGEIKTTANTSTSPLETERKHARFCLSPYIDGLET